MQMRRNPGSPLVGTQVRAPSLRARPPDSASAQVLLSYLIDLQAATIQQMERIIELGQMFLTSDPGAIKTVFAIPLDPVMTALTALTEMGPSGESDFPSTFPDTALTWTVGAGLTVIHVIPIPEGFVELAQECLIASDFYDSTITVDVFVDDTLTVTPLTIALTRATPITFGANYVKRSQIVITIVNPTATDAIITLQIEPRLIETSLYDSLFRPLIDYVNRSLYALSSTQRGG